MIFAHKIALDLTQAQAAYCRQAAGTARCTYNWALAERQRPYQTGKQPTAAKLKQRWNASKYERYPWLADIHRDAHAQRNHPRPSERSQRGHMRLDQDQHRPDDGANKPGALVRAVPADVLAEPSGEDRADNAQQGGHDEPGRSGHKPLAIAPARNPMMMTQSQCIALLAATPTPWGVATPPSRAPCLRSSGR